MMSHIDGLQTSLNQILSHGNSKRVEQELAVLVGATNHQLAAAFVDDTAKVVNATNKKWVGQDLYQTAGSDWKSWLSESIQIIVERVRKQQGGEVLLMGEGRYLLGVYPVTLADPERNVETDRIGVLIVQKDMSRDLARARRTVGENTLEMVSLLILLAITIGILVHLFLTRRLGKLVNATDRFANGDFEVRANLHGKDEVAKLGYAFDHMAAQVSEMHKGLEFRVQDRTSALANTVSELKNEIAERGSSRTVTF